MWFDVGSREQLFYKIFLSVVAGRTERMDRPTAKGRWPQSGDLQSRRPAKEPPKRPFTIPSHLPPQVQEKMREIRRDALKKTGIDPSTEGL